MSIASQEAELARRFGGDDGILIVHTYTEAKSAKTPSRPVFGEMLARIEAGEADGIISWAPDRLARNSIDGGRIIYMLDQGQLIDLKFATYTFENNTQGKFMLQIAFAQSKHYSDNLSDVIKRGNRTKVEAGWWPNKPPIGYLNDPATHTIVPDPARFALVRRVFEIAMSGTRVSQIARIARDDLNLRTPQHARSGGKPVTVSALYALLRNPFYAGVLVWNGQHHIGKHQPMITMREFELTSALFRREHRERPKAHSFPYTGAIRCGACGLGITAEHTTNRFGQRYTYYHCTRRRIGSRCREPAIRAEDLERQIGEFLQSLTIEPAMEALVLDILRQGEKEATALRKKQRTGLQALRDQKAIELSELTALRVRALISDAEFVAGRRKLEQERGQIEAQLAHLQTDEPTIKPFQEIQKFRKYAAQWLSDADDDGKRQILKTVASNPTLRGKILSIEAVKPLRAVSDLAEFPELLSVMKDDSTSPRARRVQANLLMKAAALIGDLESENFVREIERLQTRFSSKAT